jgi:diacylglycerol kinase (ATP)
MRNRPLRERLGFAAEGLRTGWLRERSFRTQGVAALAALLLLILLRPPAFWWALVAVVAAMVLALELLNSAVEGVIDLLHPGLHPEIKAIKDMIAGAVLIVSLAALVVAVSLMATML